MPDAPKLTKKQNFWQAAKFVLFSISAGVIQTVTFTLMNELGHLPYWPSYLTALVLSVLYNFTVNRRFTFQSAANVPLAMLKVALYYCVFTPLSTWWGQALTNLGWNEYLVLLGTMIINLLTEFLFCRFVVYRGQINTNDIARKKAAGESQNNP
ncbi:MAG: GtrA family protein [Eubacteriales bacterium]|nr:GtrA family protein [Eubacteriales bacterium]